MDKMMDSPWVLRIVALFLAFLLFFSVRTELSPKNKSILNEQTVVIRDVPVDVFYDDKNLIVTGIPKTVNVTIKGPTPLALKAQTSRDFSIFADLSKLLIGEHNVRLQYENISDKLQVTLDPATIKVNIEEKVTQEFRVDPELNTRLIEEGYILNSMSSNPATVYVTGAKSAIENISYVKATVTGEQGLREPFSQVAEVKVLDRDLNKLDVTIEPATVKVQVDIGAYSRELPVVLKEIGKAANSITVNQLTISPTKVRVYGKKSIIDALTAIPLEVDLSKITESKTYEFEVKLPEGVTKISDSKIKVKADITKVEQEKTTTTTTTTTTTPAPPPTPPPTSEESKTPSEDDTPPAEKTEDIDS
ncbi:YbbR-like domain-containing protein [Lysinibacillus sp. BPa_S21]|uniref:CdaR family protein n=1 Tax=Lysinibacillus sp. BPa_S21 TaxID=2932478 RepID=UPI0020122111|nr:CdaR family protein [Lysinibacillus sp. BPa_S21]MCL1697283.1 CdaR family protein [Lysinibacillus sp. BPa_S21]